MAFSAFFYIVMHFFVVPQLCFLEKLGLFVRHLTQCHKSVAVKQCVAEDDCTPYLGQETLLLVLEWSFLRIG